MVTKEFLIEKKLIRLKSRSQSVKVIANGQLSVSLQVALPATAKARQIIESAGGQVVSYA